MDSSCARFRISGFVAHQLDFTLPPLQLTLASDSITSYGDGDILIGDSAVLFTQVDRGQETGFEFEEFSQGVAQSLSSGLRTLTNERDDALDAHILNDLDPSDV